MPGLAACAHPVLQLSVQGSELGKASVVKGEGAESPLGPRSPLAQHPLTPGKREVLDASSFSNKGVGLCQTRLYPGVTLRLG